MSAQHPSSGPVVEGPHDPEHDPTASYALDRSYVAALTRRVVASSGRTAEVRSPLGDQPLAHVPQSTEADVDEAFRRARRAQEQWARTPIDVRAAALLRLHDLVLDRQQEIIDLIVWESGKARKHAFDEPLHIALTARYYGRTAHQHLDTRRIRGLFPALTRVEVNRIPKGVVGIISPWNYPFTMALCDGLPALLAGNAVVAKPDAQTMLSALLAAELLEQAGFPEDLWQVVAGPGPEVGARADRARGLHLLHRLDRHGQARGAGLCRPADRLLARARRQEPDPGPPRRRSREGRRGRGPRRVLERRPALRLDGAAVRRRPGLRPVPRAVRRPYARR